MPSSYIKFITLCVNNIYDLNSVHFVVKVHSFLSDPDVEKCVSIRILEDQKYNVLRFSKSPLLDFGTNAIC